MTKYVEPMTASIQKLFDEPLNEKILEAHLRAQQKRLGVHNAAKATQKALEEKPPTAETVVAAFTQRLITKGLTKALKALNPLPPKD
jgi:hypothetical protein